MTKAARPVQTLGVRCTARNLTRSALSSSGRGMQAANTACGRENGKNRRERGTHLCARAGAESPTRSAAPAHCGRGLLRGRSTAGRARKAEPTEGGDRKTAAEAAVASHRDAATTRATRSRVSERRGDKCRAAHEQVSQVTKIPISGFLASKFLFSRCQVALGSAYREPDGACIDPEGTLQRPHMKSSSTHIKSSYTHHQVVIYPTSSLHIPHIKPSYTPHQVIIYPTSSHHIPHIKSS